MSAENEMKQQNEKGSPAEDYLVSMMISIGQVLRRAAGLPSQENPLITSSDEAHLPQLNLVIVGVWRASRATKWHNPRAVEDELGAIRRDLQGLAIRIASLDENTLKYINDTESIDIDGVRYTAEFHLHIPVENRMVPVALSAMERLEMAIVQVIEQTIDAGDQLPATGRIPNLAARKVAYLVAKYLHDVTGSPPALWTGADPSGPFACVLREIFEILGIKAGIQRPGEYAISKLSENSEF